MFTYKPKCCLGTTAIWFQIKFIYSVSKEHKIKRIVNIIGYLVFLFLLLLQTALCLGNVCKICQQISNPCCDVLRSFTYTLYIYKASKVIARQSFRRRKCFQTTTDPFSRRCIWRVFAWTPNSIEIFIFISFRPTLCHLFFVGSWKCYKNKWKYVLAFVSSPINQCSHMNCGDYLTIGFPRTPVINLIRKVKANDFGGVLGRKQEWFEKKRIAESYALRMSLVLRSYRDRLFICNLKLNRISTNPWRSFFSSFCGFCIHSSEAI